MKKTAICSIAFEQINEPNTYISNLQTDEGQMQYAIKAEEKLEKLHFMSLLSHHVTVALFLPTKVKILLLYIVADIVWRVSETQRTQDVF